jgi:hypothetical protein
MIKAAEIKRSYQIETESKLRILASGIKLTETALKNAGFEADKSIIHFGSDEKGKLFLFENEKGVKIGANKTFSSGALTRALLTLAKDAPILDKEGNSTGATVSPSTKVENGLQISFSVSSTPVVENDVKYFEVSFLDAKLVEVRNNPKDVKKEKLTPPSDPKETIAPAKTVATADVSSDEF